MEQDTEEVLSEDTSNSADGETEDRFCRDFLRNVCRRGRRCKYLHPDRDQKTLPEPTFCHDYQNKQCSRGSCRFIHCSREEEELYRATGELPPVAVEAALRQGLVPPGTTSGEPPVCKDNLKGGCRRGIQCKFRHVNPAELHIAVEPAAKRRRLDTAAEVFAAQAAETRIRLLEDENLGMKRHMDELRRQLHALAAANELLLEQNARLRLSKGPVVSLPAVTITNTPTGPPVTIAAAVAPGSVAQVSLATAGITIAPPVVTVAQTLAPQPPNPQQAPQAPPTQPLPMSTMSISAASAPLVSFPIVTQGLRPQLPSALAR
ncbi:hypothetical protein B566_EDAN013375 [Ephemera danica]|nr:hypothetical protein B566_EDAN013375 [Ephemera danica]